MKTPDAATPSPSPSPSPTDLCSTTVLREKIDALDDALLDLLAERFALARRFGKHKPSDGQEAQTQKTQTQKTQTIVSQPTPSTAAFPALRPQREHRIFTRLLARCRERELPATLILHLWRALMSTTAFAQIPYAVCYQKRDPLCLVALGACFPPPVRLLPQETTSEVVAALSQESNALALVSLSSAQPHSLSPVKAQEPAPWWRYLFSTHAPRILQALPSLTLPDADTTQRLLLLGRLPASFLDETASFKYFLVNLKPAYAEKSMAELAQDLLALELPAQNTCSTTLSLLARHENTLLLLCRDAKSLNGATIAEGLSSFGEARHIGSTHDDWATAPSSHSEKSVSPS